ncbi:squalene/phytoene synthase family protein [Pueribacillus sp. YX66]|uniref:squalene/phytoene synthase family protein n=1 Tax=Pueribacillus sp. YX66 TaxID=3229242 RepID=UPI00358D8182
MTTLHQESMDMLKKTSRTFFIPITFLKSKLKDTVASAYLCMRAIDEIEDHESLENETKQALLLSISELLKKPFDEQAYKKIIEPYHMKLPAVTNRLSDWLKLCPTDIVGKVKSATSEMAEGMAKWAKRNWVIRTKADLDDYTYYVAGLVGCMLSDLWQWHDNTETDRELAIAFGRGLQAVNILRNQDEDDERGVSFMPEDWDRKDMFEYAENNLKKADRYMENIQDTHIQMFCNIPLQLAHSTLQALKKGKEKMSRDEVLTVVQRVTADVNL